MATDDCIFCKIADGRVPSTLIYEDETCVAFNDLHPQAPTHILIIPREHVDSMAKIEPAHASMLGHMLVVAADLARRNSFADDGYRVVINTNADGGQTVFHLHMHLLAGRQFIFPPG